MSDPGAVAIEPMEAAALAAPRSLAGDAWYDLRRNPIFWLAGVIALVMIVVGLLPQWFSPVDARIAPCSLSDSMRAPDGQHWFGFNKQGCDIYSRVVYGARASIMVGILSTLLAGFVALVTGMLAGFFGGWIDGIIARIMDVFLGIHPMLGAIVMAKALGGQDLGIWPVVLAIGLLGWPTAARVIRASVIEAKQKDYVQAARMLGSGSGRILMRHVLPNSLAPMVVVMTIALGNFIAFEATLSFLGVGPKNVISWGVDIADAQIWIREQAFPLLFPAGFLTLTVLSFIMLGDAVREAFDPRLK
jgi:peptide/nickel transport system permease protein/oligopeptide transport system permease protein